MKKHNFDVLESGEGELIVSRRTEEKRNAEDFLPCPQCNAFMGQKMLWRHYGKCVKQSSKGNKTSTGKRHCAVKQAKLLLDVGLTSDMNDNNFVVDVLSTLRDGTIASVIKKDNLILLFGRSLYRRLGKYRATEIAQRMRLLARLQIAINSCAVYREKLTLMECIDGKYFDDIIAGVETLCVATSDETGRCTYVKPSLGTKLKTFFIEVSKT